MLNRCSQTAGWREAPQSCTLTGRWAPSPDPRPHGSGVDREHGFQTVSGADARGSLARGLRVFVRQVWHILQSLGRDSSPRHTSGQGSENKTPATAFFPACFFQTGQKPSAHYAKGHFSPFTQQMGGGGVASTQGPSRCTWAPPLAPRTLTCTRTPPQGAGCWGS